MVAKVAGGIIGLGLIGTGGVAFVKPEWFGINKEITWKPLSEDSDYKATSPNDYNGKFGSTYKYYLVGATENQDWWEWSFEKLKKDSKKQNADQQPSAQFKFLEEGDDKKVTKAFDNSSSPVTTALNQICKKIYKANDANIKSDIGSSTTDYKEADVWKYCSGLGEKPKTISETTTDSNRYNTPTNSIGQDATNKTKLVSTTGNHKFWEIRNKEFKGDSGYDKIEAGAEPADAFFDHKNKRTHIRDLCEQAYGKSKENNNDSTAEEPKKDKVLKYCSLNKSSN